jgi:NAD+ synthase (glutamine-hydrolysing)
MRLVKIGIANINTMVGDFAANTDKAIARAKEMAEQDCTVGCFQEQVIGGYPAEDLVQWRTFVSQQWAELQRFAEETNDPEHPTVFTVGLTVGHNGHLYNSVAVVCLGRILGIVPKEKLPTYGVFYEQRTFSPGLPGQVAEPEAGLLFGDLVFQLPFGTMAVEVCEDIWSPDGPMRRRCYSGAELVVNASASPWRAGVVNTRREMVSTRAADNQATVVYVNQVGGNDSLVFDGGGFVNQNGRMLAELPRWQEQLVIQVVDLDRTVRFRHENTTWRNDALKYRENGVQPYQRRFAGGIEPDNRLPYPVPAGQNFFLPNDAVPESPRQEYFRDLLEAMVMSLDSRVKMMPRSPINIALSGGKDSVLSLCVAYLHAERRFAHLPEQEKAAAIHEAIRCWSLPTQLNSETTRGISKTLCTELGVMFKEVPVEDAVAVETALAQAMLEADEPLTDATKQNVQARVRGGAMWNVSNSNHGFWLQTSNMSEKAVGYTTIGGDMMGAYSLIANLPKTVIIELLGFIAEKYGWQGVQDVLATKASAELKPDQEDEDDLMPYPVLDAFIYLFAGEKMSPAEAYRVVRQLFSDEELKQLAPKYQAGQLKQWCRQFCKLFRRSIFKWVQCPESAHLGSLELDRERALQVPVVHSASWYDLDALDQEAD